MEGMWKLQVAIWKLNLALGKRQMAMWKLKLAIWKLNMALGTLQMAMWKLKMAIRKLKNEHFEAKNGQNWQNASFGPQIVQNGSPQF